MTTINYDNYESFFLMYADNELSPAERLEVETFAATTPELQAELEVMLMTVLPQEPEVFINKSILFKTKESGNLQENMLLHLDTELAPQAIKQLDESLAAHPEFAAEYEIFKKTKLDPNDRIEFPYKAGLYKHSEPRVIYMRWAKMAVAAVLVAAGLYTGARFINENDSNNQESATTARILTPIPADSQIPAPAKVDDIANTTTRDDAGSTPAVTQPANNATIAAPARNNNTATASVAGGIKQQSAAVGVKEPVLLNGDVKKNNPPGNDMAHLATPAPGNKDKLPETLIRINDKAIAALINQPGQKTIEPIVDKDLTPRKNTDNNARIAMLDDELNRNNNHILLLNEEKLTRSKTGGLLRKIKRVVERNTINKSGDEIHIAGFSFAVK